MKRPAPWIISPCLKPILMTASAHLCQEGGSAIGEGHLYVRTGKMLWCIGSKNQPIP